MTLIVVAFFTACGDSGAGNAGNKPANTAKATNAAAPAVDIAGAEAEIKKLRETAEAALGKNDADTMEKIYADNYMLVTIDGSVQTRAERLAALRSGDVKYTAFAYGEANTRVNPEGTGAIVIGKLTMKGTSKGKPIDGEYRVTQVYAKTKDGWKQVGGQATKIEGGGAAKADDKAKMNESQKSTGNAKIDAMAADDAEPPKKK